MRNAPYNVNRLCLQGVWTLRLGTIPVGCWADSHKHNLWGPVVPVTGPDFIHPYSAFEGLDTLRLSSSVFPLKSDPEAIVVSRSISPR